MSKLQAPRLSGGSDRSFRATEPINNVDSDLVSVSTNLSHAAAAALATERPSFSRIVYQAAVDIRWPGAAIREADHMSRLDARHPSAYARAMKKGSINDAARLLSQKANSDHFDVFVSYNTVDAIFSMRLTESLKKRGIRPWLDQHEIRPGNSTISSIESGIEKASCAAIAIGTSGLGPWQRLEFDALMYSFVSRRKGIIPVFTPGAKLNDLVPELLRPISGIQFQSVDDEMAIDKLSSIIAASATP